MSGGADSIVLSYLRNLNSKFDRMADDIREIKGRVGALEERYASVSRRLDSLEFRIERIERRLELIGEPVG